MSKVICAFAGLGKTYLSKKYSNIIDFDLQGFKYIYNQKDLYNIEKLKGLENKIKNKDWPKNYIIELRKLMNQRKIILVPADNEVREILVSENIDFVFIMPSLDSKDALIAKYKQRGNNQKYIQRAMSDLEQWSNLNYDYETIVLDKDEFLEDWLLKEKII